MRLSPKLSQEQPFLFVLAIITVFMTAFYIFRAIYLTFHGEYKGGAHPEPAVTARMMHMLLSCGARQRTGSTVAAHDNAHDTGHHLHESPPVMLVPMIILAVLPFSPDSGMLSGAYNRFMGEAATSSWLNFFGVLAHPMPWISMAVAGLRYPPGLPDVCCVKRFPRRKSPDIFGPLYRWAYNKWYFDELYENIIVKKVILGGIFWFIQIFDTYVIDGIANTLGWIVKGSGSALRRWQTGQIAVIRIIYRYRRGRDSGRSTGIRIEKDV